MNNKRRNILKVVWVTPVITAITLPVHAQTSTCSMADLVGNWRFTFSTHFGVSEFTLFGDGTSDVFHEWSVSGSTLIMSIDISEFRFIAELTSNCDQLSGTSTTVLTFPPHNLPENGTWVAERIS